MKIVYRPVSIVWEWFYDNWRWTYVVTSFMTWMTTHDQTIGHCFPMEMSVSYINTKEMRSRIYMSPYSWYWFWLLYRWFVAGADEYGSGKPSDSVIKACSKITRPSLYLKSNVYTIKFFARIIHQKCSSHSLLTFFCCILIHPSKFCFAILAHDIANHVTTS